MSEFTHRDEKLYLLLGEMRGDIKSLLATAQDNKSTLKEHDQRLTRLEHARMKLLGAAAALSVAASAGWQALKSL